MRPLLFLLLALLAFPVEADRRRAMIAKVNADKAGGGGGSACDTVNDASLVAYWKLDEASGTREDSKGANDLTDNATVTAQTGKISNAAEFTAANSEFLNIADNAAISVTSDFTIGFWAKLKSDQAATGFVEKTAAEYRIRKVADDTVEFIVVDSIAGGIQFYSVETLSVDTWYFIVCWYDSADKKCRIQINNGTPTVSVDALGNGPTDAANDLYLGVAIGSNYSDTLMDEAFLTKRVLTDEERTALYNSGNACRPAGL